MRQLDEAMFVSGQVMPGDLPGLSERGFAMLINNRPDHEEPGQPDAAEVEAAAAAAGLAYRHIPVAGLTQQGVEAMAEALGAAEGPVLAFCKSGTRSTYLWALASSGAGASGDELAGKAAQAGYDLTPIRRFLR